MQSMLFPVLFLVFIFLCQQGQADTPPTQKTKAVTSPSYPAPSSQTGAANKPKNQPGDYRILKTPPDLPDLPQYTGRSKFKGGFIYPNVQGGPTILLHYAIAEAPEDVLNWYKDALKSSHWQISAPLQNFVRGTKKGNSVVINTSPPSVNKGKCDIDITYQMGKEQ